MGQRQNLDDIVYGDDCLLGFDAGKTPKYVYVRFTDLVYCPVDILPPLPLPPNNEVFKLTQTEGNPCLWTYLSDIWFIEYGILDSPVRTFLGLAHTDYMYFFFGDSADVPPEEGLIYENEIIVCNDVFGSKDGIAVVTWRLLSLIVLGLINMATATDLFLELFPVKGDHLVFKYCRLRDGTNIKIMFEI